ncbi:MAG: hypothetical protein JNJ61_12145 [Anaerolineae bacterium]|nr:hypothetical protein [Anaerolineae bacterium]
MKEVRAIIERVTRLNEHYQRLHLTIEDFITEIKPGHSLLVRRLPERWDPYLREHWWPVGIQGGALVIERPGNIIYEPGEVVSLLGLVGQPFRWKRTLRHVLLLAYDCAPTPLIMSIPALLSNSVSVTLVLSGSAALYPTKHLPPEVEVFQADDQLAWPNRVMSVGWADQVFAVVNADDELKHFGMVWKIFSGLRSEIPKTYLYGVFQAIQPCGVGACQACLVAQKGSESSLICLDGPALDMTTLPLESS